MARVTAFRGVVFRHRTLHRRLAISRTAIDRGATAAPQPLVATPAQP
jgi:hypothetical protein